MLVLRDEQLLVVEVRHARVDLIDSHQLGVGLEAGQHRHDRIWEVVIQCKQPRHALTRLAQAATAGCKFSRS
jgi:hypothetical protein